MRALARHWASSGACDRPYDNHLLWPTNMGLMMGLMMIIMMAYEGSPSGLLTLLSLKVDAASFFLEARGTQGGPGGPLSHNYLELQVHALQPGLISKILQKH